MKFILIVQKTALLIAVENNNAEIVKLLLKRPEINVNCLNAITGIYGIKGFAILYLIISMKLIHSQICKICFNNFKLRHCF